jgi:pimeloyl-ACP methyl ester carboxylesterase
MQRRIPGSKLVMIEDSGHMTTAEQPEAVNQALIAFYDSL